METLMLSGKPIAEKVLSQVKEDVAELKAGGVTPGLGTILVGEDGASAITPRLGGIGPTTIAMLLRNTVLAARNRAAK